MGFQIKNNILFKKKVLNQDFIYIEYRVLNNNIIKKQYKSLLFIFASFSLKIFPTEKTNTTAFNYGVASGDPTNSNVILWTKIFR